MKRDQSACAVVILLVLLFIQQPTPARAVEDERESPILRVGQFMVADSKTENASEEGGKDLKKSFEMADKLRKERETKKEQLKQQTFEMDRSNPASWRLTVGAVQMALGRFGYGTGPFNGVFNENTRRDRKSVV